MFEASGAAAALGSALRATARGGTLVQVGNLPGTPVPAVLGDLVTREITWIGSYRFIDEITDAVQAMHEGLNLSPLITHTFKIDQAAEAIAVAGDRSTAQRQSHAAAELILDPCRRHPSGHTPSRRAHISDINSPTKVG